MAYLSPKFGDILAESKGVMHDSIAKKTFKIFSHTTGNTTDHMAYRFFPDTIFLLKVHRVEGILNRIKIDGMVNDYLSSCNS